MRILNYIKYHWKRFIIFIIFVIASLLFFYHFAEILETENYVQVIRFFGITLQNWGTLLAIFGTLFTLIWAMFQYDKQLSRFQQEKSYEVAKIFSTELIMKTDIIGSILATYEPLKEIYQKIDFDRLKSFDKYEMLHITNDEKIFQKFDDIFYSQELNFYFHEFVIENFPDMKINKKTKFSFFVTGTMNELEAVSINIASNAAGMDYLYPSLHQALLPFIQQISLNIAKINGGYTYKYYINIIEVYNNWKELRDKESKKEVKEYKKYDKLGIKYIKKVDKYQKKLDKVRSNSLEKKPRKI